VFLFLVFFSVFDKIQAKIIKFDTENSLDKSEKVQEENQNFENLLEKYKNQINPTDYEKMKNAIKKRNSEKQIPLPKIDNLIKKSVKQYVVSKKKKELEKFVENEEKRMNKEILNEKNKTIRQMNAKRLKSRPTPHQAALQPNNQKFEIRQQKYVSPKNTKQKHTKKRISARTEKIIKEIEEKLRKSAEIQRKPSKSLEEFNTNSTTFSIALKISQELEKEKKKKMPKIPKIILSPNISNLLKTMKKANEKYDVKFVSRNTVLKIYNRNKEARSKIIPKKQYGISSNKSLTLKTNYETQNSQKSMEFISPLNLLEKSLFENSFMLKNAEKQEIENVNKKIEKLSNFKHRLELFYLEKLRQANILRIQDYKRRKRNLENKHKSEIYELKQNLLKSIEKSYEIIESANKNSERMQKLMKRNSLSFHTDNDILENNIEFPNFYSDTEEYLIKSIPLSVLKKYIFPLKMFTFSINWEYKDPIYSEIKLFDNIMDKILDENNENMPSLFEFLVKRYDEKVIFDLRNTINGFIGQKPILGSDIFDENLVKYENKPILLM